VEADRMRTALLVTVSHDLRTPLAAAQAALSCLRCNDIQLTAQDHDELLATAGESLDQLSQLVTSLLDMTRLQAGALPVVPRPADLAGIIARSLHDMGPQTRTVLTGIPPGLPSVMADPALLERVIANLTANALRYSPSASPPQLTACARGDRVELRVADRGPGVLPADRERIFEPFRRLGNPDSPTGVGLGLTLCRGLTEAMHGTVEPEETPGGGLTMAISLPAVPGPGQARPGTVLRSQTHVGCPPTGRMTIVPAMGRPNARCGHAVREWALALAVVLRFCGWRGRRAAGYGN
jgi:two-component system sensor histidine kinase KdpD